jgi:cytochrome P450
MYKVSFAEMQDILYDRLRGNKCGGFFEGRRPNLMLLDPELIRQIMVRDFECFVDRQVTAIRPKSYEDSNLLLLKGTQWKEVRSISTPIFSSGKMKLMSGLIIKCTEQMTKYLDKYYSNDKKELEMKEFFGRFTLDVIASTAFGVQCNSLENPDAEFVKKMSKFNEMKIITRLAFFFSIVVLGNFRIAKLLGVRFTNKETVDFLAQVLLEGKAQRENDKYVHRRVDFLQLMLDAKAGKLKIGSETKDEDDIFEKEARLKDTTGAKSPSSGQ